MIGYHREGTSSLCSVGSSGEATTGVEGVAVSVGVEVDDRGISEVELLGMEASTGARK